MFPCPSLLLLLDLSLPTPLAHVYFPAVHRPPPPPAPAGTDPAGVVEPRELAENGVIKIAHFK